MLEGIVLSNIRRKASVERQERWGGEQLIK